MYCKSPRNKKKDGERKTGRRENGRQLTNFGRDKRRERKKRE